MSDSRMAAEVFASNSAGNRAFRFRECGADQRIAFSDQPRLHLRIDLGRTATSPEPGLATLNAEGHAAGQAQ